MLRKLILPYTYTEIRFFDIRMRQKYVILVSFWEQETPDYERADNKAKKNTRNSTKK